MSDNSIEKPIGSEEEEGNLSHDSLFDDDSRRSDEDVELRMNRGEDWRHIMSLRGLQNETQM